jgi:hypothetical protein
MSNSGPYQGAFGSAAPAAPGAIIDKVLPNAKKKASPPEWLQNGGGDGPTHRIFHSPPNTSRPVTFRPRCLVFVLDQI